MLHVVKRTVLTNEASRQTTAMNLRLPCVTSCEHHAKTRWHQGSNAKFFPSNTLNWLRVCPTPLLKATWGNSNLRGGKFVFHTGYEICFVSGPGTPLFFWLENCEKQDAKICIKLPRSMLNIGIHSRVCPLCVLGHLWSNVWSRESPNSLSLVASEATLISAAT